MTPYIHTHIYILIKIKLQYKKCFNLLEMKCTGNRAEPQQMIILAEQYMSRFQNKGCVNNTQTHIPTPKLVSSFWVLQLYFLLVCFNLLHCTGNIAEPQQMIILAEQYMSRFQNKGSINSTQTHIPTPKLVSSFCVLQLYFLLVYISHNIESYDIL